MKYVWRRGGDFTFGLQVIGGTVTGDEEVLCSMKLATKAGNSPGDSAPAAVTFSSVFVAETDDVPAHWIFTGSNEDSHSLVAGLYVADARITIGLNVIQTSAIQIQVTERVTEPA